MAEEKTSKPRRNRGEGTIRKRSDGKWEARLTIGYDANNKQIQKYVYGKTKLEAVTKLNELKKIDFSTKTYKEECDITFKQWADWCLASKARDIAATTLSSYEKINSKHIEPYIGSVILDQINDNHIENRLKEMNVDGLSQRTLEYAYTLMNMFLEMAVTKEKILRNPCRKITKPKLTKNDDYVPTPEEIDRIIACAYPKYQLFYRVARDTGMRRGEILALTHHSLDRKQIGLTVTRSAYFKDGEVKFKPPKNNASRRTVLVEDELIKELTADHPRIGLIFVDENGTAFNPNSITKSFTSAVKRAGLKGLNISLHSLRHAHAHELLKAKVPIEVVSRRLGHADIKITVDRYGHITTSFQDGIPAIVAKIRNSG